MYLKRMKLYDVKGFRLDLPLGAEGELPAATRQRMLLQAGNGGGKTTILATIAGLWELFGEMIDGPQSRTKTSLSARWGDGDLHAVELGDFPSRGQSFWIAAGKLNALEDLRREYPETPAACLRISGAAARSDLPPGIDWRGLKARSQEEVELLPNIVYFPAEGRSILNAPVGPVKRIDLYDAHWLAAFSAGADLDSLLFTIRNRQPERHAEALQLFDQLLAPAGKRVSDQEGRQGRLHIETISEPRPPAHTWFALSAGERQMLLLVVYTVCLLRDDSILIIDEPDLHIHVGMVKQLLSTLFGVVQARRGQFIVAGHSQQLWDWFTLRAEKVSLAPWRKAVAR